MQNSSALATLGRRSSRRRGESLRLELEERLREYARVKALGAWLAEREAAQALVWGRQTSDLPSPEDVPLDDKIAFLMRINEAALKVPGIIRVQSSMAFDYEWKYLATSEGSYLEQEIWRTAPGFTVSALKDGKFKTRTFSVPPRTAGYEVVTEGRMLENVERISAEAIEHTTAPPVGVGLKDIVMTPSHAMLTIHEIVAHPTELDRVVGYEANYAGTSFVKMDDIGKRVMGSKLFNVTADRTMAGGMCTVGYDDDGVKAQSWPLVREGRLVGLQTNRETAHYIGEKESRGCTFATSWRHYPFLRMPNVHVDPGPAGSPTPLNLALYAEAPLPADR